MSRFKINAIAAFPQGISPLYRQGAKRGMPVFLTLWLTGCMTSATLPVSYYHDHGVVPGAYYSEAKEKLEKDGFNCHGNGAQGGKSCAKPVATWNPLMSCLERVNLDVREGRITRVVPWHQPDCTAL